jgi:hypothetical protein
MNTRSPYPDVEMPDISLPGGPANHGSASPLMSPATAGTTTRRPAVPCRTRPTPEKFIWHLPSSPFA